MHLKRTLPPAGWLGRWRGLALYLTSALCCFAQTAGTALVRHAPTLNGNIDGSVQQMLGEAVTLNGGAVVVGDLLVPGVPAIKLNGKPDFGGSLPGDGAASPTNYTVTLSGNARLGHLRTRMDAVSLISVGAPPTPTGSRNVTINSSSQSPGDFASLRNLTLNGNVGQVAVPAGAYGDFIVNGNSGLTLGVAGATRPSVYSFMHLTLNGNSELRVVGPVIVTLAGGFTVNGTMGMQANPEWLTLRIAAGDLTLNGNLAFYGYVVAPAGAVTLNGNSQLIGGVIADRLVVNGNSTLKLVNALPNVAMSAPTDGAIVTAPAGLIALEATVNDRDGYVTKVEFFAGATKLGETTTVPYRFTWTNVSAGSYVLTAKATDNAGGIATSSGMTVVVNMLPTISLTQPVNNAVMAAPASIILTANAADRDGTVARVEFFQGATKLGEIATAPYRISVSSLSAGVYSFTARATDNRGATTISDAIALFVDTPPVTAVTAPPVVTAGTGVTLSATATDADGTVAKVEFYRGTVLIGTAITPSNRGIYSITDASILLPGSYSYRVRTYDNSGLFTESAPVVVRLLPALPYLADFETTAGYVAGALDGQLGWTVTQGTATVTDQLFYAGAQSLLLAPGVSAAQIAQAFASPAGRGIFFADFFARPVADADLTKATIFDVEGARFVLLRVAATGVLQAFNGDGSGGGQWRPTKFTTPLGADAQAQSWVRLSARLDFTRMTWDLYAGGNMVAADLGFRDASATYFSTFAVRGSASAPTRLDDLFVGADNPLFVDVNNNGIDDAWETAHGLSLTTNNRVASPTGNGVTVIQAYIAGTDPNDYYNGTPPVIVSLVAGNGQPEGSDGLVAVRVAKPDGTLLPNAPLTFSVISGPSQIAVVSGGALAAQLVLRTDAQGVGKVYLKFNSATSAVLMVSARSGAQTASLSLTLNAPVIDTDRNGLPDDWEVRYFGHVGVDPNADDDGDGVSNLQEWRNGTDPIDYYNGVLPNVASLVAADGKLGSDGSLSVRITDLNGVPQENAPATFRATVGGHLLASTLSAAGVAELSVRTDAQGVAKVFVKPGSNQP